MHNLTQHWLTQHWPLRAWRITDHVTVMDEISHAATATAFRTNLRQRLSGTGCALPVAAA